MLSPPNKVRVLVSVIVLLLPESPATVKDVIPPAPPTVPQTTPPDESVVKIPHEGRAKLSPPAAILNPFAIVEVPLPATLRSPPMYPIPEVSRTPSVVVALPMPRPPVRYESPATERSWAGVVVPMPTLPELSMTILSCNTCDASDTLKVNFGASYPDPGSAPN